MNVTVQDRIIAAATELFGQRGYGSTSVRELVEAAGVTKPTLYYHFGSKEGLFVATAQRHLDALDAMAQRALAEGETLEDKLAQLLHEYITSAATRPDVARFLMTCLHQVEHGQPEIDLMSIDATLVQYLGHAFQSAMASGEIREDIDLPIAVISFLGVLRAWALGAFHGAPLPPDVHRTAVHQFLHGITHR